VFFLFKPFPLIGGLNCASLLKFMQNDGVNYSMALITDRAKFVLPEVYFACSHSHIPVLKLESATVSAQCEAWSRLDTGVTVTEYLPAENKVRLSNDKEYTYKALVVTPGFN
jgi:hypothetical protein